MASKGDATRRATTIETTVTTPLAALRNDEIERMRLYARGELVITSVLLVLSPFLRIETWADRGLRPVIALAFLSPIVQIVLLRDPGNLTFGRLFAMKLPFVPLVALVVLHVGPFSIAPGLLILSLYVQSLGADNAIALGFYLITAGIVGTEQLLVTLAAIRDVGMVRADTLTTGEHLALLGITQGLYAFAYGLARVNRRTSLATVEALESAVKQASQREVLLREANEDLERMHGGRGRASGERVGAWRLGLVVGRGGMGEVYEATHVDTGKRAAVKLLAVEAHANPSALERFRREADVLSRLESKNVVGILDVGVDGSGPPFIAMELLVGEDLGALLRREPRLSPSSVLALVGDVASALAVAHGASIVHRDLKPQNLFFSTDDRCWKVLDFGISKLGSSGATLTMGNILGTPGYMAPEQAKGSEVDLRADVFSLAAIAYRAITGHPAFGGSEVERIYAVMERSPVRPADHTPVPRDVELVLALSLAKRRDDRLGSAPELSAALTDAYAAGLAPALRSRAERLLAKAPWGAPVHAPPEDETTKVDGPQGAVRQ